MSDWYNYKSIRLEYTETEYTEYFVESCVRAQLVTATPRVRDIRSRDSEQTYRLAGWEGGEG